METSSDPSVWPAIGAVSAALAAAFSLSVAVIVGFRGRRESRRKLRVYGVNARHEHRVREVTLFSFVFAIVNPSSKPRTVAWVELTVDGREQKPLVGEYDHEHDVTVYNFNDRVSFRVPRELRFNNPTDIAPYSSRRFNELIALDTRPTDGNHSSLGCRIVLYDQDKVVLASGEYDLPA